MKEDSNFESNLPLASLINEDNDVSFKINSFNQNTGQLSSKTLRSSHRNLLACWIAKIANA